MQPAPLITEEKAKTIGLKYGRIHSIVRHRDRTAAVRKLSPDQKREYQDEYWMILDAQANGLRQRLNQSRYKILRSDENDT